MKATRQVKTLLLWTSDNREYRLVMKDGNLILEGVSLDSLDQEAWTDTFNDTLKAECIISALKFLAQQRYPDAFEELIETKEEGEIRTGRYTL